MLELATKNMFNARAQRRKGAKAQRRKGAKAQRTLRKTLNVVMYNSLNAEHAHNLVTSFHPG
jgi:hypothetical protein